MEEKNNFSVPYIVYEGAEAKSERTIRRLIIALLITIVLMFISNAIWIIAFCGFDYVDEETTTTVNANSNGTANYIGQDGDITYGTDYSEKAQENKDEAQT